ncbi:gp24 [Burkholderia phage BcepMu]|uniref:Gp24 n=2 Tax=root TaxID=1 RepID=Q6QIC5_BPBMU|nr:gp24 [Burkholderia phage BcepMu]AAS47864.1 gp24 [Burkholderia phage BcepMu]CAR57461.1 putative proline-rich protein Rz1 [Burkholderia cenocepacia J2315]
MSRANTARRRMRLFRICLAACSLPALSACGTPPPAPMVCPRPVLPPELLRRPAPMTPLIPGYARTTSSPTTSTPAAAAATSNRN